MINEPEPQPAERDGQSPSAPSPSDGIQPEENSVEDFDLSRIVLRDPKFWKLRQSSQPKPSSSYARRRKQS